MREKYLKLGELLIKEGMINNEQLEKAIALQKQEGCRLGEALIKLSFVSEDQILRILSKQLALPHLTYASGMLHPARDQGLEKLIPHEFAIRNYVLPISRTLNSLTIAMADPLDLILRDNIKKLTTCEINIVVATRADIMKAIEEFFGKSSLLRDAVADSYKMDADSSIVVSINDEDELSLDKLISRAEEAPVVKLVDLIVRQAITERASDIHIEPFKDKISLRYRIDGKLYEIPPPAKQLHLAIISRLKILAKLDIAEKRLPQDGALMVKIDNKPIDIRLSSIPTIYGEKIVMRILDTRSSVLDLGRMGLEPGQLEQVRKVIKLSYGLILVTGPTGSGKSTTLYAILNEIKNPAVNVVTVEDPVEYKLDGINQVQVKPEIGLTFAAALRSFLRQDPDIMLVGEVRDLETAQICIRSALTGHLVLSTLHTNDAASAVSRLIDIGVEPYLVSPSLLCIIAQRLVRKLCSDCKEAYEPSKAEMDTLKIKADLFYRPKGCPACNNLGFKGRISVAEVLVIDDQLRELISQRASFQKVREVARAKGMMTLYQAALKKVEQGITTFEEACSVTLGVE